MKKLFSKITGILLSASLVFSLTISNTAATYAYAAAETTTTDTLNLYSDGAVVPINDYFVPKADSLTTKIAAFSSNSVEQTIYDGLNSFQKRIDVEKFNLSSGDFKTRVENVLNSCPELFYVEAEYSCETLNDRVISYMPKYNSTPSQMTSQKNYLEGEMNKIISQVDSSWTDFEKIVFIHDYLAQNFEYDTSYKIYDAYQFFTKGKGVCQAYTAVFAGLMTKLGIDVTTAASDSMQHIWNVVKLNGKWYHVDVTWDDPTNDKFGLANHNNLLLSDSKIASSVDSSSKYHHDWVTGYKCIDKTYDNYFWLTAAVTSPFKYLDGKWYYAKYDAAEKSGDLYSCDLKSIGNKVTSLGTWTVYGDDNSYYSSTYCGLDIYQGKLFFNTQDSLCYYSPSDNETTVVNKPSVSGKLYGMRIRNNNIQYAVTTDYNKYQVYSYKLEEGDYTPAPSIDPSEASLGDVTLDGKLNLNDAKELLKAALGIKKLTPDLEKIADLDFNNKVDLNDAKIMLKISLGIVNADSIQKG